MKKQTRLIKKLLPSLETLFRNIAQKISEDLRNTTVIQHLMKTRQMHLDWIISQHNKETINKKT